MKLNAVLIYIISGGKSLTEDLPNIWINLKVNGNQCFGNSMAERLYKYFSGFLTNVGRIRKHGTRSRQKKQIE